MADSIMRTGGREVTLKRLHTPAQSPLRAWSSADVLVLDELPAAKLGRVLIVNDEFGALTCALADAEPTVWTDSALSRAALSYNLRANGLAPMNDDRMVRGDELPAGHFDTIVVRIPKSTALLDYQLAAIATMSDETSTVVGTGMVRHIHTSTVQAFERLIGPTTTSRATRKARLIFAKPTAAPLGADTTLATAAPQAAQAPRVTQAAARSEFRTESGVRVVELPGTFSAGHLDVGSRLLLDVLRSQPVPAASVLVADLGCGNGVLSAEMATHWPNADFLLLDASDLAVAAATQTWHANELGERMTAQAADGFESTASDSIDIVITNPPFHQGHALDPDMTDRLLAATARVLRPEGTAYVVVQRHLHLHTKMRQWFERVEVATKHPTHVVLIASQES